MPFQPCLGISTNIRRNLQVCLVVHEAGRIRFGYCMRLCPSYIVRSVSLIEAAAVTTASIVVMIELALPVRRDHQRERFGLSLDSC